MLKQAENMQRHGASAILKVTGHNVPQFAATGFEMYVRLDKITGLIYSDVFFFLDVQAKEVYVVTKLTYINSTNKIVFLILHVLFNSPYEKNKEFCQVHTLKNIKVILFSCSSMLTIGVLQYI